MNLQELLTAVKSVSVEAGAAILKVYQAAEAIAVVKKADNSPLTQADLAANTIIVHALEKLRPDFPVLSEESVQLSWQQRKQWQTYWLVDPLDGTREFINRNGEFTVNIALIDNGVPVLGVVYVPVPDILYYGARNDGAYKQDKDSVTMIQTAPVSEQQKNLRVVASRRHHSEELEQWLASAKEKFPDLEIVTMGSSLKICLVAEGKADIYPRLAPTSEWDTAAAHAILEAAGGVLTDTEFKTYRYNQKEDILNPFFFAVGDSRYPWSGI